MKLYAYQTPDIPKHDGYLKIGETHRSTNKRIHQQGGQVNVEKVPEWQDAIATDRKGIDRLFRHFLRDKYGFHIQPNISGHGESEWVKCTVDDIKEAFPEFKELFYQEQKERQIVTDRFYNEIRNWFYWTTQENKRIDADYALRLVVRLLFCFFLREKNELVPKELLDANIEKHLKKNEEYSYYNGILRNLFFHCLNTPQGERKYENEKLLADKKNVKGWFSTLPFLNGGIFDEHDKDDIPIGNDYFFSERRKRSLTELDETCDVYGIITILSKYQYKLTLDDLLDQAEYGETVDPEFIGKVFESLLSCIDADSKENRRRVTGSYYTPREIVDYMVNTSLDAYLETQATTADDRRQTANLLLQCRILDPACGSGAFPCEAMNIIMHRIEEEKKEQDGQGFSLSERYRTKLKIVRDVIYGVDIQPMAVQITLLRFFLTLIQDIIPDKQKSNCGIEPLPNLDIKFVCADTLIPLDTGRKYADGTSQKMLENPIIRNTVKSLRDNRNQYFMASMANQKQGIRQIDKTLRETLTIAMENDGVITQDTTKKMATWNPYDQTKPAGFFDSTWMFGIEDGFDIVIGNPPYLKEGRISKTIFQPYKKSPYYHGKMDLWYMFACHGIDLLKSGGHLCFIATNNWVTNSGASILRNKIVLDTQIKQLADFGNFMIFESASIQTMIMLFSKNNQTDNYKFDYRKMSGDTILADVLDLLNKRTNNKATYLFPKIVRKELKNQFLTFGSNNSILDKISGKKTSLIEKEVAQGIVFPQDFLNKKNQGILEKTYLAKNEVANGIHPHYDFVNQKIASSHNFQIGEGIFGLSTEEKEYLHLSENELDLIKPYYTTEQIQRYYSHPDNKLWLIYTKSSFKDTNSMKDYPPPHQNLWVVF